MILMKMFRRSLDAWRIRWRGNRRSMQGGGEEMVEGAESGSTLGIYFRVQGRVEGKGEGPKSSSSSLSSSSITSGAGGS
jgi:hypothetical protein